MYLIVGNHKCCECSDHIFIIAATRDKEMAHAFANICGATGQWADGWPQVLSQDEYDAIPRRDRE